MEKAHKRQPQVIIIGAGFGGLEAAKKLACKDVRLTVIDRTNYHLFQPLFYQVATAALSPADIAAPIRGILSKCKNVEVVLAEVESVDVETRKVKTNDQVFDYDYLILATGARHSYFGHDEWEKLAPGLKSLEDAVELRRRILLAFEYAEKIEDEAARKAAMTFVIIGGGPTGVEMAGAIAEISRYTLAKNFRHIDPVAGTGDPHRRRAAPARGVSAGFVRERAKTIARAWRGSAHERTRDEHYRRRCTIGWRIYSVPRENLGGRQHCVIRRENAQRTG